MRNFWKAFGITAALAALVPVRVKQDEETGKKTYQSLLMSLDITPNAEAGDKETVGLNICDGVVSRAIVHAVTAKREAELFADDEPEAALLPEGEAPMPTPVNADFEDEA